MCCLHGSSKSDKTDNGSGYTSKAFQQFFAQWQTDHKPGIPYNPQGQ